MSKEEKSYSDSEDDDYIPNEADHQLSEVDSEENDESDSEEENHKTKKKRRTRTNKTSNIAKRRKKVTLEENLNEKSNEEVTKRTEEEEKNRADALWADFIKDTGVTHKERQSASINKSHEKTVESEKSKFEEKIKITEVFKFAGEEVKIEKEVPVDSVEARLSLSTTKNSLEKQKPSLVENLVNCGKSVKTGNFSGISSILGHIGKKAKISTLEKSKLDWESYKKEENLEEEISTHNKGKDGYLERQDFLQRADLRRFEIEKQLRNSTRRSTQ
ncbi:craniofacial development protein 1 [Prorops nasuta]|uniref:craniofacial development protein 1 n=1 Tax=Prorops nasuta TaxID=863751 RepID=UPI0034CFFF57